MSAPLAGHEQSALESFRAGDAGPLKGLAPESLQRVMRQMSRAELVSLETLRERGCRHASTEVSGVVRTEQGDLQVVHCLDCGLIFERR